ncbi:ABC transporter permease [Actinomadura barringtoniae]|uniref:ABC transporter permease n=1 Tax=Actinomadura barringtoniae TaxID=1427535 RepID=A0A939PQV4_9ACTN|nr:ABC transporter permease [Actinomadura barringtoniae]MBO2454499.1 ABC transporter permease [Actinomadura barringtoniae]
MTPRSTAVARRRVLRGALGAAGFLALAELASRTGLVDRSLLPPPSATLADAARLAADGEFLGDLKSTVTAWLLGLALAVVISIPVGLLLGSVPRLEAALRPLVEFLRPIPGVAIIPLAMLLFPDTLDMQMSVIVYASCWPMLINTLYGLREVDPVAKETLASFGFGPFSVLYRVSLPSTAPFILTGVRLSAAIALIVAVSAELIVGGATGIGTFITTAGASDRTDQMLAATAWAGALGLLANALLAAAERRLFRWHKEEAAT